MIIGRTKNYTTRMVSDLVLHKRRDGESQEPEAGVTWNTTAVTWDGQETTWEES